MNIRTYVVLLSLVVVSGCWKRKKNNTNTTGIVTEQQSGYTVNGQKNVFDEEVDAFTLEDDQNPFGSPEGGKRLKLVDDNSTWNTEDRKGDFETIYYEFDSAAVRPDQQSALERNEQKIRNMTTQGEVVVIEGHACKSGGSAVYNMALSVERGEKVKDHLVKKGIPANKLTVVGRGSEMCKIASGNKNQQAPNRRVDMYTAAA